MAVNIVGVPSTRVSNQFITSRLLSQVNYDQIDLYRLQAQLSTGLRFQRPGEDPIAAAAVLTYQIEIERKTQSQSNLLSTQSYLSATDTALLQISNLMDTMRALGLEAINTTTSDIQRGALAQQAAQAVRQLMDAGNQKFRDRYLFAGSSTDVRPFEFGGSEYVIRYTGNETRLQSYVDVDLLYASNMTGTDVFRAISEPVRGTADVDPALTPETRLAELNGGLGVRLGSIRVSNGNTSSTIDLAGCETIGDVVQRLHDNPPLGSSLHAAATPRGLQIWLDPLTPGNLQIRDVGNGTTARELGIFTETGVGMAKLVGKDLNPVVTATTRLENLLGSKAQLACQFVGPDNDFIIRATRNDASLNGMRVLLERQPGLAPGSENAQFDGASNTLTIYVSPEGSLAQDVVRAAGQPILVGGATAFPYTVELDPVDRGAAPGEGLIEVDPGPPRDMGMTEFGRDGTFDASGLQITNGGITTTIEFTGMTTVEQVLNALNGSNAGVVAEINAARTGIDIRSRISGADFMIGENGGATATQFGVRTLIAATPLSSLNFGRGVMDYSGPGSKAQVAYQSVAANSGLVFRALAEGSQWNDYDIRFVDTTDPGGAVTIAWDPSVKTITIGVTPGVTTANDIVAAFKTQPGPRDAFEVSLDKSTDTSNTGQGVVYKASMRTDGGEDGGIDFTITRHDGTILEIDVAGARTVQDILHRINTAQGNEDGRVVASLATHGNGIVLTDHSTGPSVFTIARSKLSMAAIDLGLIPAGQEAWTATSPGTIAQTMADPPGVDNALLFRSRYPGAYGNGVRVVYQEAVPPAPGDPVTPSLSVGTDAQGHYVLTFHIESGVTTARDVQDLFNQSVYDNIRGLFEVVASGPTTGTIDLTATGPLSWTLAGGESAEIVGVDANPGETQSLFTALLRLQEGLEKNDMRMIQHAVSILDDAVVHMNYARANSGAMQQSLDFLKYRLQEEQVELRTVLSNAHDADLVEVVSNLTTRQVAMEAGFKAISQTFRMSLIDYL